MSVTYKDEFENRTMTKQESDEYEIYLAHLYSIDKVDKNYLKYLQHENKRLYEDNYELRKQNEFYSIRFNVIKEYEKLQETLDNAIRSYTIEYNLRKDLKRENDMLKDKIKQLQDKLQESEYE